VAEQNNRLNLPEIREKILLEIERTPKKIIAFEEMSQPVAPDVAIGRISRMDAINNKSVAEASLRQAHEKLEKLHYVLSNIGKPGFGNCMKCGKEIPVGRILIRPESVYCIQCAR
jgi:DnaK suppressor protein